MPTVAVTSTLAMVRAAEARGVRTATVLKDAGVALEQLEDPDGRLEYADALAIWDRLRELTGDPALQLAAPLTLPWGSYRVIDYVVAASDTVGEGVERFARFFGLITDGVKLLVEDVPGGRGLTVLRADGGPVPAVYVDYIFAALVSRVRVRMRPELSLMRLELRSAPSAEPEAYREAFRTAVRFGAVADRLCFSEREWNAPLTSADATLAQLMEDHIRMMSPPAGASSTAFIDKVREAVLSTLPGGAPAEEVAAVLHVSVRTLQRKLEECGTTLREVTDSVSSRLAEQYLAGSTVSIAEVAFLLGFSDQSSFNRAFRRWTGEAPGRWRKLRRQAVAEGA